MWTKRPGLSLQRHLARSAKDALAQPTFVARNQQHARVVGFESGLLAGMAAGITDGRQLGRVIGVFTKASRQAGQAFASAFAPDGSKVDSSEPSYKQAMNAAGGVASDHLVAMAHAFSGGGRLTKTKRQALQRELSTILSNVRVEDLTRLVSRELGKGADISGAAVVRNVEGMIPKDDWAYGDIAKMKVRGAGEQPLTDRQLTLLSGALRLANATWKAGQVHRAAWEGNTSRITPSERGGVYNPYDVLKVKMYNDSYRGLSGDKQAAEKALSRVVFEVFKDLKQLTL